MAYVAVAVALLLWGGLVGRVGTKLGTALAVVPVLGWFGVLAWSSWSGVLETPAGDALHVYMLIGLFAFLIGSNVTSRSVASRKAPEER